MDFPALSAAMKQRRHALGRTIAAAVDVAGSGISVAQWSKLENEREGNYRESTYTAIDRGVSWPVGTALRILNGEPAPDPSTGMTGNGNDSGPIVLNSDSHLMLDELAKLGAELNAMRAEFGLSGQRVAEAAETLDRLRAQVHEARSALDRLAARVSALEGGGAGPPP